MVRLLVLVKLEFSTDGRIFSLCLTRVLGTSFEPLYYIWTLSWFSLVLNIENVYVLSLLHK